MEPKSLSAMQRSYARVKAQGLLGRRSDPHWNNAKWMHECCGSRAYWRHKIACPWATSDGKLPPE